MKGWRSGAAGQRTRGCICACLCLHCGVLSTMSGFMMRFVLFFLWSKNSFFFFILGLKGTERLHRRSTDERERESKGVKKEELLSLLKNSIALFFFSSLLASFHACGDVCAFLVSSSKVRRSLRCSVNTGKQEKKKATTNTQAARKWTQAGRLRLKDRVRGARSVT